MFTPSSPSPHHRSRAAWLLITSATIALAGCENAPSSDLPLRPVPLTEGDPTPTGPGQSSTANPAGLPQDHPPVPSSAGPVGVVPTSPMPAPSPGPPADVDWAVPDGWTAVPPASSMRTAQWSLPGSTPEAPADCAMLHFSGGGTVRDNIERWLGQMEQPDGSDNHDHAEIERVEVGPLEVTTLTVAGTYLSQNPPMSGPIVRRPGWLMYAAIFPVSGSPYFLKCTGPEPVLRSAQASLVEFVRSFRVN